MQPPETPKGSHALHCMEIWGGNHAIEKAVAMPGLDAWVYSKPFEGAAGATSITSRSAAAAWSLA